MTAPAPRRRTATQTVNMLLAGYVLSVAAVTALVEVYFTHAA